MSDAWLERMSGTWRWEARSVPDAPGKRRSGVATIIRRGIWTVIESDDNTRFALAFNAGTGKVEGEFVHWDHPTLWVYDGAIDPDGRLHLHSRGPSFSVAGQMADYDDVFEFLSGDEMRMTGRVAAADGTWSDFTIVTYRREG